jgi:Rrf2 family iron-sulfur cluster assembly transcriptional regulator
MLDLALNAQQLPCPLSAIAMRQNLSRQYLEQLFTCLRRGGLVHAVRGIEGGYSLARPATEISVEDILTAVDKPLDVTRCAGKGDCQGGATCLTHHLWVEVGAYMRNFLAGITLDELRSRNEITEIHYRQSNMLSQQDNSNINLA